MTSKSSVRSFHSQRGEGKLFNADLLVSAEAASESQDSEGSEIRIAFFNESVDLFFDYLQQGHVYDICNVKVRCLCELKQGELRQPALQPSQERVRALCKPLQ